MKIRSNKDDLEYLKEKNNKILFIKHMIQITDTYFQLIRSFTQEC